MTVALLPQFLLGRSIGQMGPSSRDTLCPMEILADPESNLKTFTDSTWLYLVSGNIFRYVHIILTLYTLNLAKCGQFLAVDPLFFFFEDLRLQVSTSIVSTHNDHQRHRYEAFAMAWAPWLGPKDPSAEAQRFGGRRKTSRWKQRRIPFFWEERLGDVFVLVY